MTSTYRAWDGLQDPLRPRADVAGLLDELSHDLLQGFGGRQALREMLRRGPQGRRGLDDLRRELHERRRGMADLVDVAEPMREITRELDQIVQTEQTALGFSTDEDAAFRQLELDTLPDQLGARLQQLRSHRWESAEAAEDFRALDDRLRKEFMDAWFRDLSDAAESVTPEDIAATAAMLAELNDLLDRRAAGEDIDDDFEEFLDRHADQFPERPTSLDELLASLRSRMAGMARLVSQMTPEQRAELFALNRAVLDDLDLELQLQRLQEHLGPMDLPPMPGGPGGEGQPMPGPSSSLAAAVGAMEQLNAMDRLDAQLAGMDPADLLGNVDEELLARELGPQAVEDLRELRQIEKLLSESGAIRHRDGDIELTPRGARLLGERALTGLLDRIEKRPSTDARGSEPEATGQVRRWRFGDTERIAVGASVREALRHTGPGEKLRLRPDDFLVEETEVRPRTATALLLDLSWSMPLQGHFVPAKRMALALAALIEGKHRQDSLHLVGFSDYARPMQPADLSASLGERVYGTNMQHAFLLARRLLTEDPRPVKQVIMVTDGEPTSHLVGSEAVFNWPPVAETIHATLIEAKRLARAGISINVFLLEDAPGLVAFAERLSKLTGGQVFPLASADLGERILRDYLGS